MPKTKPRPHFVGNLWIAHMLYEMGCVLFGDFTTGRSTEHSPIYINPRPLVSNPRAMRRIARILHEEILTRMKKARPEVHPFQVVAGVPFGGLHLATVYSLRANTPLVYVPLKHEDAERRGQVEGRFKLGQTCLIIDDLMTTGGSVLETAKVLEEASLIVKDAVVLIDRDQGGKERLKEHGYNVVSLLNLKIMLNYYMANHLITENWYHKSIEYLGTHRHGVQDEA
ncbi:MAG: phosphoribosyltransferase [Chloroflexi bacterium]|nr:phosphoribosyltransferase [Chloroflexota bacterium]